MGTYTESLNSRDNHGARRPRAVRGGLERESGEEPCGALFAGPECGLDPLGQHWKFTEFLSSRKPEGRQQSDRIEAGKPFLGRLLELRRVMSARPMPGRRMRPETG